MSSGSLLSGLHLVYQKLLPDRCDLPINPGAAGLCQAGGNPVLGDGCLAGKEGVNMKSCEIREEMNEDFSPPACGQRILGPFPGVSVLIQAGNGSDTTPNQCRRELLSRDRRKYRHSYKTKVDRSCFFITLISCISVTLARPECASSLL